jgi:hypothetical protein
MEKEERKKGIVGAFGTCILCVTVEITSFEQSCETRLLPNTYEYSQVYKLSLASPFLSLTCVISTTRRWSR